MYDHIAHATNTPAAISPLSIGREALYDEALNDVNLLNIMPAKQNKSAKKNTSSNENGPDFAALLVAVGTQKDKEAFIKLFDHYAPRLKSFFIKGGLKPDIADELAQETMLTIWDRAETFDPSKAAAGTWIYTIARNKRIDFFRKTGRPEADPHDPLMAPFTPEAPDSALGYHEEKTALDEALKTLPDEQSAMIRKAFFEDKTHSVIADETGLPLGTVKSRIRLALDRLRHALNDKWGDNLRDGLDDDTSPHAPEGRHS